MTRLIIAFLASILAATLARAQPPESGPISVNGALEQMADGHARFAGRVELTHDWFRVVADHVDLSADEEGLVASGNVEFIVSRGGCYTADRVEILFEDGEVVGPLFTQSDGTPLSGTVPPCSRQ